MKKKKWIIVGLICIAFFVMAMHVRTRIYQNEPVFKKNIEAEQVRQTNNPNEVILHYHDRKPYYFTSPNGVNGLCAEPATEVFTKAGIPFRWKRTPAKRQLEIIKQNDRMECAVGWFKNPEREKFAKYTLHIYQDKPTLALARADNERVLSRLSLEQIFTDRGLNLLRKDGYSYGKFIDEKIVKYKPRDVMTTVDNLSMLKMTHSLRADYFFIAEEEAQNLITESPFVHSDFKYVHFSDMPKGNKRYIICTRKVSDDIISKLNQAIQEHLQD